MIKGIANGVGVKVSGGDTSVPYVSMNNETPMQGMIRVWGSDMQVFDSSTWRVLPSSYATVTLDSYALDILDWARKKKIEEEILISLPNDHPAVKIARENLNKAKQAVKEAEEQLKITEILSQDETTS
jgi:hypothetical protein